MTIVKTGLEPLIALDMRVVDAVVAFVSGNVSIVEW
jgi:hypothetical protein